MKLMKKFVFGLVFSLLLLIPASLDHASLDPASLNSKRISSVLKLKVKTTAYYTPLLNQKRFKNGTYKKEVEINGKGKTFSGKKARWGFIAADLKVFPLGTILKIPGYGIAVVEDKGGAIKRKHLDLFMGHGEIGLKRALRWGKREIEVEVLKWGRLTAPFFLDRLGLTGLFG